MQNVVDRQREKIAPPGFNPRRALQAERLAEFLSMYGRKCFLPRDHARIKAATGMESWAVAQAADDLFDAGLVDVREAGDGVAVEMLAAPAREPARGRLQFSRFTPRRPAGRDRGRA